MQQGYAFAQNRLKLGRNRPGAFRRGEIIPRDVRVRRVHTNAHSSPLCHPGEGVERGAQLRPRADRILYYGLRRPCSGKLPRPGEGFYEAVRTLLLAASRMVSRVDDDEFSAQRARRDEL